MTDLLWTGDEQRLGRVFYSMESRSEHPLAEALAERLKGEGIPISDFENLPGRGVKGGAAGRTYLAGNRLLLEENGIAAGNAEIDRLTAGCVGVRRTTGQHPGGLVVVPDDMDIEDFCPVQHPADDPDSDTITTHFEYHCMEDNLLKLDMLGHDDPTMIRMLENLTGVNARAIPLDDPDTMSIFISSKVLGYENDEVLGPTGAVAIPEFNTRFTRQMLVDTQPKDFNTLLRLSGFSHGTDVWLGNAKDLIVSGTASVLETVGCRDDIMLYLISMGLDPKMSFKIMEAVRKGKVKGGKAGDWPMWVEEMRKHDVPEWYIESLAKIGYLFPKAHAVAYVMMAFRIAWFKVHEPLAFYATFFSIRAKAFDAAECCKDADALRRRIREIFRLSQGKMKQGYDCIVVARTRAAHADYWELKRAFEKTCKKLDLWETQA